MNLQHITGVTVPVFYDVPTKEPGNPPIKEQQVDVTQLLQFVGEHTPIKPKDKTYDSNQIVVGQTTLGEMVQTIIDVSPDKKTIHLKVHTLEFDPDNDAGHGVIDEPLFEVLDGLDSKFVTVDAGQESGRDHRSYASFDKLKSDSKLWDVLGNGKVTVDGTNSFDIDRPIDKPMTYTGAGIAVVGAVTLTVVLAGVTAPLWVPVVAGAAVVTGLVMVGMGLAGLFS